MVVTDAAGDILGAAGVSGGLPQVDEAIIVAAVESVGLVAMS